MKEKELKEKEGVAGKEHVENKADVTQKIPGEPWNEEVEPADHHEYMFS
ncbi:MAG: hypothetical protein WC022_03705 [Parcubacteria group bacterium]